MRNPKIDEAPQRLRLYVTGGFLELEYDRGMGWMYNIHRLCAPLTAGPEYLPC